jgi:hypothetical protein
MSKFVYLKDVNEAQSLLTTEMESELDLSLVEWGFCKATHLLDSDWMDYKKEIVAIDPEACAITVIVTDGVFKGLWAEIALVCIDYENAEAFSAALPELAPDMKAPSPAWLVMGGSGGEVFGILGQGETSTKMKANLRAWKELVDRNR